MLKTEPLPNYGTFHGKVHAWYGVEIPGTVLYVKEWVEPVTKTLWIGWKNTSGTYGKAEVPTGPSHEEVLAIIMAMRLSY